MNSRERCTATNNAAMAPVPACLSPELIARAQRVAASLPPMTAETAQFVAAQITAASADLDRREAARNGAA